MQSQRDAVNETSAPFPGLAEAVGIWLSSTHTRTFSKGRVALYALLRAAGIGPGDEVVLPGFTCVVVPAAVGYTGASPVYHDIDSRTFNGDPALAAAAIGPRTRALIVQHTFGLPADLGGLPQLCRERGVVLIEDCAHAIGATRDQRAVGTLGDAAFCSLQWSKPATIGLGGIARFNAPDSVVAWTRRSARISASLVFAGGSLSISSPTCISVS